VKEIITPPDNRNTRPAVTAQEKAGSIDPLGLAMELRKAVLASLSAGGAPFTLTYYDGRRLTELSATYAHYKVLKIGGKKFATERFLLRRKPLAGYTKSELEDIDPNEPSLNVFFDKNNALIPVRLEVPLNIGKATATLM